MSDTSDTDTNTDEGDNGKGYATYNGMGREALALGVPVVPFAFTLLFGLFTVFGGLVLIGFKGALGGAAASYALFQYQRALCAKDSRALRKKGLEIKRLLLSLVKGSRIILITPLIHQRRRRSAERFFHIQALARSKSLPHEKQKS